MNSAPPPFDHLYVRRPGIWLALIAICYLGVAFNFAIQTPRWQAPDEPAHYNYIEHIATTGTLPVLRMGDYNQRYQSHLVDKGFPAESNVGRLRYESYQPPLYYLTAALVYRLSDGSLLALRALNIGLGLCLILLTYQTLLVVFPQRPLLTLGATAFTAFLPMHVAITAAINNDVLAELLVVASVMVLLVWMRSYFATNFAADEKSPVIAVGSAAVTPREAQARISAEETNAKPELLLLLGVLLGLGLLTKIYAYALVPLCVLAIVATSWWINRSWRIVGQEVVLLLYVVVPAMLMALPWWLRSSYYYGAWDLLGLRWHDRVVAGQPTTTEWIASNGIVNYSERALNLTFKSFWGVFGWLGVFLDDRIYTALLVCTGVLFLGLLWSLIRLISGKPDSALDGYQRWVLLFFALMIIMVTASYGWYNLKFVQHQGRYFFWGLLPISTFVALGWREIMRPLQGVITGILALILAVALAFTGYIGDGMDKWTILTISLVAMLLLLQPLLSVNQAGQLAMWLPTRLQQMATTAHGNRVLHLLRFGAWLIPFLLLFVLSALIPTLFIVPQLTR